MAMTRNWVTNGRHDDWYRACRLLRSPDHRRRSGHDHIHVQRDKFGRKLREALRVTLSQAPFDDHVAPVFPAVLS